jgi:Tfp pilus assembly protein PilF
VTELQSSKLRILWIVSLIAGLTIVYRHSFDAPFIYDDFNAITNNASIHSLSAAWHTPVESTLSGRPIVRFSLAINYQLGELNPRGYHAFNFALHVINALLLFGIIRRTPSLKYAQLLAMGVATVWALHPLQTEAVIYVTQRTELLMAMFFLLTLYASIRAFNSPDIKHWPVIAIIACALGMASKEVMVGAPLVVLLYDRLFFAGGLKQRPRFYAALAVTWIILIGLMVLEPRGESAGFALGINVMEYLATQASVIWHYIRLCVWPTGQTICYDWPIQSNLAGALVGGLLLLALLIASLVGCVKRYRIAVLGVWFFFILAPTSSIVPIVTEIAAERRMYLPSAALIMLVWLAISRCGRAAVPIGCIVALSAAWMTNQRVLDYKSEITIWRDAAQKSPHSLVAHSSLATALFNAGHIDKGITVLQNARDLDHPDTLVHARMYSNLSGAFLLKHQDSQAQRAARFAIEIAPDMGSAHINLGIALRRMQRIDESLAALRKGLQLLPDSIEGNYHLAYILIQADQPAKAEQHLRRVIQIDPNHADAHDMLGVALAMQGRIDDAVKQFKGALKINPQHMGAKNHLAKAQQQLNN